MEVLSDVAVDIGLVLLAVSGTVWSVVVSFRAKRAFDRAKDTIRPQETDAENNSSVPLTDHPVSTSKPESFESDREVALP